MKTLLVFTTLLCLILTCCAPASSLNGSTHLGLVSTATTKTTSSTTSPMAKSVLPNFDHIVLIMLENRDYISAVDGKQMPQLAALAKQNVLLSNYYAVTHPSLPNYIALMSGSTQDITSDCTNCYVNQPNLADEIEASGRTWKAYLEDLPSPCFVGNVGKYAQKHNPLIYFDSIRRNATRCDRSILPLTSLDGDLANNTLPNFSYIMPNLCNSGHDCSAAMADQWVGAMVAKLQASPALGKNSLIIIAFDEAGTTDTSGCCGLPSRAGGQVAVVLVSPTALPDMTDNTPYSHYSLLKTILTAWNLPALGNTAQTATQPIEAPWTGYLNQSLVSTPAPTASTQPAVATQQAVATPLPPPPAMHSLAFPIRAAFFYPWFPQSWDQKGMDPFTHYQPTLGFYNQDDPAIIPQQIAAMQYGKIQLGIASWWGQGDFTDTRFKSLLSDGEKVGFYWSVYMESEGVGNPSIPAIRSDLQYIHDQYASSPAYLKIGGRFVVFVYSDSTDNCGMVDRWTQANTVGAYLVLREFRSYQKCTNQPDAWHQYAPDVSQKRVGQFSYTISPGFWSAVESQPGLARDLQRWNKDIQAMVASKAHFQLITTFNEWGEGTAVESASEWISPSGFGQYLDALHYDGSPPLSLSQPKN